MKIAYKNMDQNELPNGYFTDGDIEVYRRIISSLEAGSTIIEIGVWNGRSICSIADLINKKSINSICIDHFKGTLTVRGLHFYDENIDAQKSFEANVKRFNINPKLLVGKSLDMVNLIPDNSVDCILIDADHSREAASADIKAFLPKIKKNGIMCGHDYVRKHKGVIKAVNATGFEFELFPGSSLWSTKNFIGSGHPPLKQKA